MRSKQITMALVCAAVWVSCESWSPDPVTTFSSPTADFTRFKTFAVAGSTTLVRASFAGDVESILQDVNNSMKLQLQRQGLKEVRLDQHPEVVVFSLEATSARTARAWDCAPGHWYGQWNWDWTPCAWLQAGYSDGTVVLGLADTRRKQVVFGGTIRGIKGSELLLQDRINYDVLTIFGHYPPPRQPHDGQSGRAGTRG